jgi:hypothetical protein
MLELSRWGYPDLAKLWQTYVQLTERLPHLEERGESPPDLALDGPARGSARAGGLPGLLLWVCLKKKAEHSAPSLTPWQILDQLGRIALVEVWFELRDGRRMCLPRLTQPEPAQVLLLAQLNWSLPQQPPPRVYAKDLSPTGPTLPVPSQAG